MLERSAGVRPSVDCHMLRVAYVLLLCGACVTPKPAETKADTSDGGTQCRAISEACMSRCFGDRAPPLKTADNLQPPCERLAPAQRGVPCVAPVVDVVELGACSRRCDEAAKLCR